MIKGKSVKEWIKPDEKLPEIFDEEGGYSLSHEVAVFLEGGTKVIAKYQEVLEDGEIWKSWYCPAYEDVVENVIGWCPLPPPPLTR